MMCIFLLRQQETCGIGVGMYVATVPNRNSPPAILLREGYREGGKVKNRTLANLSKLPPAAVEAIRRVLKGEQLVSTDELFEIVEDGSPAHGNVEAVLTAMRRLGFAGLLCSRSSRQRDLVVAMVAARILKPQSKLALSRSWSGTTLADMVGIGEADEDEMYEAMDWLLERQDNIEKKLAVRHLKEGGLALYDLTSSYFEGVTCPLAALGHNRDGKKGKLQVNYGLLASEQGIPVAVSVFEGNAGDPKTLLSQVDKIRESFGIGRFVIVGDRGMITQKQVDALREIEDVDWLTALRPEAIRKLLEAGAIQMSLFDERNLFEIEHPDWPGERLIACRNPELAERRRAKRASLLEATANELDKVRRMVGRGRPRGQDAIGVRVGKVINKYKVAKHFVVHIDDDAFDFQIDQVKVGAEAALDGIYVVRTSVARETMDAPQAVRSYKHLSNVERAFRCLKSIDLMVRPIWHHLEDRVRAHIFLCTLVYYVQWHMTEAWRPLLFADEDQQAKAARDPVAPAKRSAKALNKVHSKRLDDGSPVQSFRTLIDHLGEIVRNTCRCPAAGPGAPTFHRTTTPNAKQRQALDLLGSIKP
jgi:transposase